MMKEITVVMPVYKVEKYVSECLDSIINQTFDCFECIIIDDCSPDNSMRLIEEKLAGYKGNISFRIVRNERNEGVSAARNGNTDELADAICRLIEDTDKRIRMGKQAQKNIQRYSREEVMKLWNELFNTLTTTRP